MPQRAEQFRRPACASQVLQVAGPSSAKRGYGWRWQRLRLMVLARRPLCADCARPAVDVHHQIKLRDGGPDSFENLLGLCHRCHSRRTARGE